MPKKKKVLITEFTVLIYSDGSIAFNGFDEFLRWKLSQKPKEGFLPFARKIQRFGICAESGENTDKCRVSRR
ncbi:MAG TPA: hypothetical protein DCL44_07910 [Elusimicrobia bacterium]|nr:hypothetical protein [Elusimicrobiota bacterium]